VSVSGPVVADTHVFLWYLQGSSRLSDPTRDLLDAVTALGEPILVSAVTIVELRYLAEKGTLTEADVDALRRVERPPAV
jgi:PIN domain nuclease of toxin-antitoxin system